VEVCVERVHLGHPGVVYIVDGQVWWVLVDPATSVGYIQDAVSVATALAEGYPGRCPAVAIGAAPTAKLRGAPQRTVGRRAALVAAGAAGLVLGVLVPLATSPNASAPLAGPGGTGTSSTSTVDGVAVPPPGPGSPDALPPTPGLPRTGPAERPPATVARPPTGQATVALVVAPPRTPSATATEAPAARAAASGPDTAAPPCSLVCQALALLAG